MHPSSHLIVSWLVGQRLEERRDRLLVAYAGVAPDLDGLSLLAGVDAYGQCHHVLTYGVMGAAPIAVVTARVSRSHPMGLERLAERVGHCAGVRLVGLAGSSAWAQCG